jgi:hypothetical protein
MTTRGRRIAFTIGAMIAFALPKRVDCGYPEGRCEHAGAHRGELCTPYEVEPWGLYLIELALDRDVGFAYTSGDDCR